jgi:hypothetical protein
MSIAFEKARARIFESGDVAREVLQAAIDRADELVDGCHGGMLGSAGDRPWGPRSGSRGSERTTLPRMSNERAPRAPAIRTKTALERARAAWDGTLPFLLWGVPLAIGVVTTWVIVTNVLDVYPENDPTLRWTVIAAVLAGAGLLIGLLGLPLAVTQLVTLRRSLTRSVELQEKLKQHRLRGYTLSRRLSGPEARDGEALTTIREECAAWVEAVATFIQTQLDDEAEEHYFHLQGHDQPTPDQVLGDLEAKLLYVRDNLWPKVRAGFW